ncbi:MAG TPA: AMP-binding protein [Stellaceae bacterium]|nr:AMP-binding protein [Stellaceae bacterium]
MEQLEGSQWWSPELLQRYQFALLERLLAHAHETVPFYRTRLAALGYRAGQSITPEFWRQLPILKRSDVQDQGDALKSTSVPAEHGDAFKVNTSGSTATPLSVWRTDLHALILQAIVLRRVIWQGCDFRLKFGTVMWDREDASFAPAGGHHPNWGSPAALAYQTGPAVVIDNRSSTAEIADWLLREQPDYLRIVPTLLKDLRFHCRDQGLATPHNLKAIMCGSEVVSPDLRELVRRTFRLELFGSYGAREIGTIALQCPDHPHYHVQAEATLLEVLDESGNPCAPGETGTVILTSLHGYASPLIRYEIGDRAVVGSPCPCGRPHPVLQQVVGRTRDRVVLPSGKRRYCYFGSLAFWEFRDLRQFQVIQRSFFDLEVRLVARHRLTPDVEAEVARRIKIVTGEHFSVRFTYHDSIPLPPGGKFQDLVCEVDPADAPESVGAAP